MNRTYFRFLAILLLAVLWGCSSDANGLKQEDVIGQHRYWLETDQTRQMDAAAQELARKFRENNPFIVDIRPDGQLLFTWFQNTKGENGFWKLENGKLIIRKKSDEEATAKGLGRVISGDYEFVSRKGQEMILKQGDKVLHLEHM